MKNRRGTVLLIQSGLERWQEPDAISICHGVHGGASRGPRKPRAAKTSLWPFSCPQPGGGASPSGVAGATVAQAGPRAPGEAR